MAEEGSEQTPSWKPDKTFYQSNPRSNAIREACIPAINALNRLLSDPEVGDNLDLRSSLYSRLEEINGRLVELGIEPGMHLGKSLDVFRGDPVTAAEFLASQLIPFTGRTIPSETEVMPIVEEFTEEKAGDARIVDSQSLPERVNEFRVIRGVVAFIEDNFDIKPDDKEKQQSQR